MADPRPDQRVVRRDGDPALATAAALADPIRRQLYTYVRDAGTAVPRDDAAAAVGVSPSLAGYHLDQLAADGILSVSYARRSGRSGPGAGRPAKYYEPAPIEVTVQLPARDDELIAKLLAAAVEADASGAARRALRTVTRAAGRALGRDAAGDRAALLAVLDERGYAPVEMDDGIRLRNCPFHHLVGDHLELVCNLNKDLLGSAATAAKVGMTARLDPQPGMCCVVLRQSNRREVT